MKKSLLFAAFCALALSVSAQNPFAYALGASKTGTIKQSDELNVAYTLNADATAVKVIVVKEDGSVVKEVAATEEGITKGSHTIALPVASLPTEENLTFKVEVTGAANAAAKEVFTDLASSQPHGFWSPYGIAIDNDPNSPHFGRVLFTETQANMTAAYFTGANAGAGIYEYDPQGNPVPNAEGKYGYNPLNFQSFKYGGGQKSNAMHAKKVRISKDGRIFVGVLNTVNNPIYEVNPDNLNEWTPVFEGTLLDDYSGYIVDAEGNMVASPSAAFDVWGEGENLKLVNLGCKFGQNLAYGSFTMYEYNLGTAKTIKTAPTTSQEVIPLSLQYTISSQNVSIAYDADGKGIWYGQYRADPSELQPSYKHASLNEGEPWTEDYSDISVMNRGGGIYADANTVLMSRGNNTLGVYGLTRDANGAPTLTEKYIVTGLYIRGLNDIAVDYAGNVYVCDNGIEILQQIQLPNEGTVVETPAATGITFKVEAPSAVNDVTTAKAITSVRYYNMAGQESAEAFNGVNVMVTTYADGSKTSVKVVK